VLSADYMVLLADNMVLSGPAKNFTSCLYDEIKKGNQNIEKLSL
jgi:hypothetical protein